MSSNEPERAARPKLFGTDGIRGRAGAEPVTVETTLRLAMASARRFTNGEHRNQAVVGKDTRLSGYMLEAALTAGLAAMGMDVVLVGPMPTPAVAMLTRSMRADLGVMISASHNHFEDNGIKLFGPDGYKLSDDVELEIEAAIAGDLPSVAAHRLGRVRRLDNANGRYIEAVKATFPRSMRLEGLRIVVDCANGASYRIAPAVFQELGAEVVLVGASPDGLNINVGCGAAAPDNMRRKVVEQGANAGVAFDGDADRVIMCDELGRVLDGDQLLGLVTTDWHAAKRVRGGGVVATVMSNLGLERYLATLGLELYRARVGDRYLSEMMLELECNLGGEQSGHMLLNDHTTTGDGIVTALQVLAAMVRTERALSEMARVFEPLPQRTRSIMLDGPSAGPILLNRKDVQSAIRAARDRLGLTGRVLVRRSGTEPVIRVTAESEDAWLVEDALNEICAALSPKDAVAWS